MKITQFKQQSNHQKQSHMAKHAYAQAMTTHHNGTADKNENYGKMVYVISARPE